MSEKFALVFDTKDATAWNSPPLAVIRDVISYTQKHYPGKLSVFLVANVSYSFKLVWTMISPLLSRKTLQKSYLISSEEVASVFAQHFGAESEAVELDYGGRNKARFYPELLADEAEMQKRLGEYFAQGVWPCQ
jgi:hypothetical protein